MKKNFQDPLFFLGLAIRISLIGCITPASVNDWYVPFLDVSTRSFNLNPWEVWLNQGGVAAAFPYGYVMWLLFLPLTLICKIIGLPLAYGYGATLLVADTAILVLLRKLLQHRDRLLLIVYWLSPIVIIASYFLGFNDLLPVLLLIASLYCVRQAQLFMTGLICIAAISAKLSMMLAVPFFLIYLFNNRALRQFLPSFIKGLLVGTTFMLLPFILFSSAGLNMLLNNPEIKKIYLLAVNFGDNIKVYIVPLVYLLMLYATWRVRRLNFELFNSMMGLAFLLVVLMTPASPGWFIWAMPLLVFYQLTSDRFAIFLVSLFSVLYVISSLLLNPSGVLLESLPLKRVFDFAPQSGALVHTAMVTVGIILAARIWRETVSRNDFFRLSRKPFVIGIAGDSGAGKDTFSDAIGGLFGGHSVTTLSGDDYHLWDRHKPMWQVMTHLNPMANDLERFANDLVSLTDGKSIQSRHYNHQTGQMSRPFQIRSNDIIIASGLHALYLPILRQSYNLSIYLDIDEDLRRHFKIKRDVHHRGHPIERVLSSFERREPDSQQFIRPQSAHADLVLSLQPIHPRMLQDTDDKHPLRLKLFARSQHGFSALSLTRVLIGICGLHVDIVSPQDSSEVELTIEGETSGQDIALAAQMICPKILEFLDIQPKWQDGILGLMQLITLCHINQALTKRFTW